MTSGVCVSVGLILTVSGGGLAVQVEGQQSQLHCGGQGLDVFGKQNVACGMLKQEMGWKDQTTWSLALQGV